MDLVVYWAVRGLIDTLPRAINFGECLTHVVAPEKRNNHAVVFQEK